MKINCARTLGRQLRQMLVEKGTALADDLAGKSVIRQGMAMTVDSVKTTDRKITTVDMMGKKETATFDKFFAEPVTIIHPDLLLQDITGDDVDVSRVGRYLFRGGQRWQVNKITKNEAGTLLTLESDGKFTIKSREELIREKWQIRKFANVRSRPFLSVWRPSMPSLANSLIGARVGRYRCRQFRSLTNRK